MAHALRSGELSVNLRTGERNWGGKKKKQTVVALYSERSGSECGHRILRETEGFVDFFSVGPKKTLDSTSTRPCPMPSKSLQFIHSSAYSVLINRYDQESKVKKKKPTLTF